MWQANPYSLPLTIAVIVNSIWAVAIWKRESRWLPGKLAVAITFIAAAWTMGDALQLASADPNTKLSIFRATVLIAVWLATLWFILALSLTGQVERLKSWRWLLIGVVPLMMSVLTLLDHRYHLIVANVEFVRIDQTLYMGYDYGIALLAFSVYAYALQIAAALIFVSVALRAHQLHWRQMATITFGWMTTAGLFLVDLANQHPAMQPRLLPLSVLVVFPLVAEIFHRLRRADLAPVAREVLIDKLPDPILVVDRNGTVLDLNPAAERVFGTSVEKMIGLPLERLDKDMAAVAQTFLKTASQDTLLEFCRNSRVFDVRSAIVTDWRHTPVGQTLVLHDITDRKKMEADLLLTQFCVDHASIGIMRTGRSAEILSVNNQCCEALGYTEQELRSLHVGDIDPNFPLERWHEHRKRLIEQGSDTFESIHRRKDGTLFPVEIFANSLSFHNQEFSISFIRDITERKLAAERIAASLHEKEVLLKEIHHRVKNNLQIISSLLNLQSDSLDDPQVLAQFQDSQNRIRSMALIHERLYRSDDLAHIDFGSYLKDLTGSLVQTYRQQSQHIALQVEADTVMLDIDSAIPCGLIVSELTSNALKHAFPNGRPGRIQVALRCEDSGQMCRLIVSDDGIGMPGGLDYQNTLSLGLQLVNSLTHQLSGTVAVETGPGTRFEILFPTPNGSPEAIDTAAAPAVR